MTPLATRPPKLARELAESPSPPLRGPSVSCTVRQSIELIAAARRLLLQTRPLVDGEGLLSARHLGRPPEP